MTTTPTLLLAATDPIVRDTALMCLLTDVPGAVALRYDLLVDSPGSARRVTMTATGVHEDVVIDLEHTCVTCGTNEDIVLVVRHFDVHLFEDSLFQLTFEQAIGPEKVRLAVGKFSLLIAGRYPSAISTVGGTGLVTPSF